MRTSRRLRKKIARMDSIVRDETDQHLSTRQVIESVDGNINMIAIEATRENSLDDRKSTNEKTGVSLIGAICNILTTAVGVGMLALPNAIAQAGYVPGFVMLAFCVGVALICCWLLKEAMWLAIDIRKKQDPSAHVSTYEHVGAVAYGNLGRYAVAFALHSALIGCSCLIALLMGKALHRLAPAIDTWLWIVISCSVMIPFVWLRTMKHIGLVSATFGTPSIVALTITVIVAGFMYVSYSGPATWISGSPVREYDPFGYHVWGLGTAFGTLTFAFAVTCTLPTILNDMEKKSQANRVIAYGVGATSLVYSLVAVCGFLGFGSWLVAPNVDNIFAVLEPGTNIATCTDVLVLLVCITHYAVMINPSCRALESALGPKVSSSLVFGCAVRTGLVVVTALVAIFCGKFSALVDLIGSVSFALVHMVFPPIFYLKLRNMSGHSIYRTKKEKAITIACGILVLLALLGGTIGAISAIVNFINA
jgi:amino acid permease